jgi:hypothetical protein
MKWFSKITDRLNGLTNAIIRYPLTELFLIVVAVIISISINMEKDYTKPLLTCVVGAILCASLQATYERFFSKVGARFILMGVGAILTLGYYLIIRSATERSIEIVIRTSVTLFALYFAYIWIPVIRSRISFNESFMAAFKALNHSAFYSVILYCGCSLIIVAIDTLIIKVNYKAYSHIANIIFVLFAPLFFFSLIPKYPGVNDGDINSKKSLEKEEIIKKAAYCPKFLEILISYIIIPLTAVFTFILLLYITLNIRGAFWTNNLLEPMLITYAITVILIYILSSRLENKFAVWFRLIFPKLLVPIVLFQIVSSLISLREIGVTHTRYFAILFGLFAACAGIVMSLVPVRKNGIIAAMLIGFSVISIIPPVDAFTVSRLSQEKLLKAVLIKNKMLSNNTITPNDSVSDEDKKKIISFVEYLSRMGYTKEIAWLPDDFIIYEDFYDTENTNQSINVFINSSDAIDVAEYDVFVHTNINSDEIIESKICDIEKLGRNYILKKEIIGDMYEIILMDEDNREIIHFNTNEIFTKYNNNTGGKGEISTEEATFSNENNDAKITVVVQNFNSNISTNQKYYYADIYILVQLK